MGLAPIAYAELIPHVVALLAYLAGFVVAVILLVRAKGTAAILAMVGFALLTLISIGQIVLALPPVVRQIFRPGQQWVTWLSECCCGLLDLAAIVCLIVAIWRAVSGAGTEEVLPTDVEEELVIGAEEASPVGGEEIEEMVGEYVESPEEAVEEHE